ncbi:MAG: enoyl-CoA hydratase/isomerase family protein [Candidatus Vecturithrix sp.]|jgi:enoyl-CoA hydratase/carnithine racemase|nr:enoyl-CoA hydratase/isomerase family protein [Candidatus Vecturithrix sp.]
MTKKLTFEYEDGEVMRYMRENVAVIKLKGNVFGGMTDLETVEENFSYYDLLEEDTNVNALVVVNEHGIFGEEAYREFLTEIAGKEGTSDNLQNFLEFDKWIFRAREIRVLQRLVMKMLSFQKICISGLQGTVVTPFFGLSLAADFRFATEDMRFSLTHANYGLHPNGALAFFLPRYLPQSLAVKLLLEGGEIPAEQALELGLITAILPRKDFETHCIEETQKLCAVNPRVVSMTKPLLYHFKIELQEYFATEANLFELKGGKR